MYRLQEKSYKVFTLFMYRFAQGYITNQNFMGPKDTVYLHG